MWSFLLMLIGTFIVLWMATMLIRHHYKLIPLDDVDVEVKYLTTRITTLENNHRQLQGELLKLKKQLKANSSSRRK